MLNMICPGISPFVTIIAGSRSLRCSLHSNTRTETFLPKPMPLFLKHKFKVNRPKDKIGYTRLEREHPLLDDEASHWKGLYPQHIRGLYKHHYGHWFMTAWEFPNRVSAAEISQLLNGIIMNRSLKYWGCAGQVDGSWVAVILIHINIEEPGYNTSDIRRREADLGQQANFHPCGGIGLLWLPVNKTQVACIVACVRVPRQRNRVGKWTSNIALLEELEGEIVPTMKSECLL